MVNPLVNPVANLVPNRHPRQRILTSLLRIQAVNQHRIHQVNLVHNLLDVLVPSQQVIRLSLQGNQPGNLQPNLQGNQLEDQAHNRLDNLPVNLLANHHHLLLILHLLQLLSRHLSLNIPLVSLRPNLHGYHHPSQLRNPQLYPQSQILRLDSHRECLQDNQPLNQLV